MTAAAVTADFEAALELINDAGTPSDVFGSGDPAARYRRLAKLVHPDVAPDTDVARATKAFARLGELWAAYRRGPTLTTRRHTYRVGKRLATGDLADLVGVSFSEGRAAEGRAAVLKLVRDPCNNDLLRREAVALELIARTGEQRRLAYVPHLVERFVHRDPKTGVDRAANVLGRLDGFHTLAEVAAAYPGGLDARDVAWMWRRLLVAIGLAHRAGVVHGAVLPDHVLLHLEQPGVVLVDWCYSVVDSGDIVPAIVGKYSDWYPPEVARRLCPSPATDIYLATRCMTHLMGGRAPAALRRVAHGCTLASPAARPQDAWRLLAELDDVLEALYGPRRFRALHLPAPDGE